MYIQTPKRLVKIGNIRPELCLSLEEARAVHEAMRTFYHEEDLRDRIKDKLKSASAEELGALNQLILSDERLEAMAEESYEILCDSDSYWEAYWQSVEMAIEYAVDDLIGDKKEGFENA